MKRSEDYRKYSMHPHTIALAIANLELGMRWLNDRSNDYTTLKGLQESIRRDVEEFFPILIAKSSKHVG
jgi:hypothetical protein